MKRLFIFLSLSISILSLQIISCGSGENNQNQPPVDDNPPSSDLNNLPSDVALQGVVDGQNIVLKESEVTSETTSVLDLNINGIVDSGEELDIDIRKESSLSFTLFLSNAYFFEANQNYFTSNGYLSGIGQGSNLLQRYDVTSALVHFSSYFNSNSEQTIEGTFSVILTGENNWLIGHFHSTLQFERTFGHPE